MIYVMKKYMTYVMNTISGLGNSVGYVESDLTDQDGAQVAKAQSTCCSVAYAKAR